jgi:tryptophan-rich sensory protein
VNNRSIGMIIVAVAAIIFLIIIGPIITIWSLNTLFPVLAIPYNIWTWLATVFLFAAVRANVSVKRKD